MTDYELTDRELHHELVDTLLGMPDAAYEAFCKAVKQWSDAVAEADRFRGGETNDE